LEDFVTSNVSDQDVIDRQVGAKQENWGNNPLGAFGTNLLGTYLLVLPPGGLYALWWVFGRMNNGVASDRDLLLLAMIGGALGSYLHVSQSFAAYVGNRQACASWVWWYLLRTPIGACLGVLMYIVVRAGLLGGTTAPSPYGVLAFAALAGWFSKQATDKLAEVFDTLFKSEKKEQLKDKLKAGPKPQITMVVAKDDGTIVVAGTGFEQGATVRLDKKVLTTSFKSDKELRADVPKELASGKKSVVVVNPSADSAPSDAKEIDFSTVGV
jgi:hypothetical protein